MRLSAILNPKTPRPDDAAWGYLTAWLEILSQQNFSTHTINAYHQSIIRLLNFLENQQKNLLHATRLDIEQYFGTRLEEDGLQVSSIKQELAGIRKFCQYLTEQHYLAYNPTTGYKLKTQPRNLPKVADESLIARLLDQPIPSEPMAARLWVRDKAMFELMYSSGLRVSELVGLNMGDINFDEKIVRVLGKGNKVRQVPVGSKALIAIKHYLPHRDLWQEQNSNALFISERFGTRLSVRAVQLRLTACATRAGIELSLHPHLLRHCFASHLLTASGDLRAVQDMLGHTNISTTQIYTQVDFGTLSQVYDGTHPRANKKSRPR